MKILIKNGRVVDPANDLDAVRDVLVEDGIIHSVARRIDEEADEVFDVGGKIVTPGWIDVHVHFREPGFEHKEDIASGSRAAAAGGITSVAAMPNLKPCPDSPQGLHEVLQRAKEKSVVNYYQLASITYGEKGEEVTDFASLKDAGAIAFTDDGFPVDREEVMLAAMKKAKAAGVLLVLHEEDTAITNGGAIIESETQQKLGCKGAGRLAEASMVKRDIALLEQVQTPLHFQHISTRESIQAIKEAKARGLLVTCETTPHYFSLSVEDVERKGTNAKMNPPLKTREDVEAVRQALKDGTIDIIGTDHAPHAPEEKAKPLNEAPNGIIGLETMVGVCVNELIHGSVLEWKELVAKVTCNPAQLLGLNAGNLTPGMPADVTVIDPLLEWVVDAEAFESKSRNCPWDGEVLKGKTVLTVVDGKIIMKNGRMME